MVDDKPQAQGGRQTAPAKNSEIPIDQSARDDTKPNKNAKIPDYILLTEGYDPEKLPKTEKN